MNQSDAYRAAYNAENMSKEVIHKEASLLASSPSVSVRIEELNERQRKLLDYDLTAHLKDLDDVANEAAECKQYSVTGKMRELKGKALGMYTEKQEIDHKVSGNISINIVTGGK